MTSEHCRLGDFITSHPEFFFDLEDCLRATKYTASLRSRFASFCRANEEKGGTETYKELILATLARGELDAVPAYRNYPRGTFWEGLPMVGKPDLRERPLDFVSTNFQPDEVWLKSTTGSSGPPIPIWYSPEFYFDLLFLSLRKIAARRDIHHAHQRPIFCISISDYRHLKDTVFVDPEDEVGLSLQVVVDPRNPESFRRVCDLITVLKPACIATKPSIFEMLLQFEITNHRDSEKPLMLVSSGSLLSDSLRHNLQASFGTVVVNAYAMTEFGLIASECACGYLHIDTSGCVVETLGPDGLPVEGTEQGEIVISSINNRAMPLLRYQTRDLGVVTKQPCECGLRLPRLLQLSGRKILCFRLKSGGIFSPTYFNDLFSHFPGLREFQITQRNLDEYEVLVELRQPDEPARKEVVAAISAYITSSIPDSPYVRVIPTVFTIDSKFERFRAPY